MTTLNEISKTLDRIATMDKVVINFERLPKGLREVMLVFLREEKARWIAKRERNPDTCYGSSHGNVCDFCDDKCANNPNQKQHD